MTFEIEHLDKYRHRIRKDESLGMRTDVIAYASDRLLSQVEKDQPLEQAVNVASLPGIAGPSLAMPDIHQGYGFPIGGVAATDFQYGVVSPGGVGFDINCGVRLAVTSLSVEEVQPRLKNLVDQVFGGVPCGTDGEGRIKLNDKQLTEVLANGAHWMVKNGYGEERDTEYCEENGRLAQAAPDQVSARARERGRPQFGTIGSGNHFLEIQRVERVHDADAARAMNLEEGRVVVLMHCGSRGLGTRSARIMSRRWARR
jgi:tRNA-splicing ligase RtcB